MGELVTAVSRAQANVDSLNLDLGGLQESVNQSLVDLHDAQVKAEQARRGKDEAKRRLDEAQERVDVLRAELDELSRSQYRGASPGDALVAVSGKDTQRDVLDRSFFLRQRSEEKRAKLAEAEQARAEAANEEATLREASELADASEAEAKQAEANARELLDANRAALEASVAERDAAQSQLDSAQKDLEQQRPAQAETAETPSADNAASAEAAEAAPDNAIAADPYAATLTVSKGDTTYEVPEEVVDLVRKRVSNDAPEAPEPSREVVVDAVRTVAQTSSASDIAALSSQAGLPALDSDTIAKVGAVAAGIAMVGGVAANHGSFDSSNTDAVELVTAFADGLNGALGTVEQTSDTTETADSADSLSTVLPEVETAADVSAKTQKSVAAVSNSSQVETVIARAQSAIGTPYVWGGGDANGPTTGVNGGSVSGFDCSGLVLYAFAAAGVALPHYTGYQYQRGTQIPASEAQRGDLLFWGPGGNQHVAIYLGDGTMIEAPQSGQNVTIAPVRWSGMAPNAVRLL
ncbi:C40 family peptidase [Corynebacterium sp. Marseille-Q3615]|uniref:C40 family peptidase n=2 Tax=Corynebacterium haemomassiliense TaxID=2754726 RepID=A0A7W2I370_9CORY|nr:NlpC/P60 family protein [Corynebacterium haemomassiliense]MBA5243741.1 C40 family peptidase [Corynebacterium haemomassiliense]